jgi:hypothetical protein
MGSSLSSMKFNFHSQPSEIVLLVIESAQLPFLRRPAMISIHGVIIAARCSMRLFDAWNLRCRREIEAPSKTFVAVSS